MHEVFFTNIKLIHKNKNEIHKNKNEIHENKNEIHKNRTQGKKPGQTPDNFCNYIKSCTIEFCQKGNICIYEIPIILQICIYNKIWNTSFISSKNEVYILNN